jgi:hypothetical protein
MASLRSRRRSSSRDSSPHPGPINIPEEEQWRLINETGVLVSSPANIDDSSPDEEFSLADEIFDSVLLIVPFSFLLLLMDMCVSFGSKFYPSVWDIHHAKAV